MVTITVHQKIKANANKVFSAVADIRQFSKIVPHVDRFKILSEEQSGIGTRFQEVRVQNNKETTTELEVTEYVENEKVRMVADSHGTIWDTTFTVTNEGEFTSLNITMEAKSYELLPKLINPLVKGMMKKAIATDMEFVKAYCENQ